MSPLKYFNYESKYQKHSYVTHSQANFDIVVDSPLKPRTLNPNLYTCSLYENPSFIIVSVETKYSSTRS